MWLYGEEIEQPGRELGEELVIKYLNTKSILTKIIANIQISLTKNNGNFIGLTLSQQRIAGEGWWTMCMLAKGRHGGELRLPSAEVSQWGRRRQIQELTRESLDEFASVSSHDHFLYPQKPPDLKGGTHLWRQEELSPRSRNSLWQLKETFVVNQ